MVFKPNRNHYLLFAIFFLVLASRLYYAFQTPYFSESSDYFTARQVEHIKETGLPLIYDELSYGGRMHTGSPVFYYALAFFNLFMPIEIVSKVVMNIFASLIVIVVYLTANELTKNTNASLFSAFISGYIPIFFRETFNSLSIHSIAMPLLFFCIYCFLKIENPNYIHLYLAGLFLLMLLSPIVLLLIMGFVFYMVLMKLDRISQSKKELEVILFSVFFTVWFLFIIYKKAFFFHGYSVIWQNVPKEILSNYFGGITILSAIYQIGSIPLLYAIYAVLQHIYRPRYSSVCLFSGFAFSTVILLWLKLIQPQVGLIYLGGLSVLLFAQFYKWSFDYWQKTHFAKLWPLLLLGFIISFILTSVLPSFAYADGGVKKTISQEEMELLKWLGNNTEKDAVILAPVSHGHLITGIAKRKNVADDNFLLVKDAEERYTNINEIYASMFETEALRLLTEYDISYIMLTPDVKKKLGINELKFASGSKCFSVVYNRTITVYESKCRLKTL